MDNNIDYKSLNRWRLILGSFAEDNIELSSEYSEMDNALGFLYDREYGKESGYADFENDDKIKGGKEKSSLTVPIWVAKVKKLFPKNTVEIMQNQALEKYNMTEMLTDENILKEMEPNMELLKNILTFKDMMNGNVKKLAYDIVRKVVEDLKKKLESDIKKVFYGKKLPNSTTSNKIFKNLDVKKTIRNNLKNYNIEDKTIFVDKLYFNQNIKKYNPWHIIILIDESGSMMNSVIYSSIMASIFANLPYLSIKLIIFDTSIVDLTDLVKALEYAKKITTIPEKTIVLLISDLYDSNDYKYMYKSSKDIIEARSKLFVLPALDYNADSSYDKNAAKQLARIGAKVDAITPNELSKWISNVIS